MQTINFYDFSTLARVEVLGVRTNVEGSRFAGRQDRGRRGGGADGGGDEEASGRQRGGRSRKENKSGGLSL